MLNDARIKVIIGHYGSGKTEFSVNYAIALAQKTDSPVALADLDVVNPYFRSRERHQVLEDAGVTVYSSQMGNQINFELPSMDAGILAPLQSDQTQVILDVGGDAVGARVLARYQKYLKQGDYDMFAVVNTNRPQTADVAGIVEHITAIEQQAGVAVTGIINNTHFLRQTTVDDVLKGQQIIVQASEQLNIPIKYVSAIDEVAKALPKDIKGEILSVAMHMRDAWM